MSNSMWKSALLGAGQGLLLGVILILIRSRYTFAKDWPLIVMIVFANATGMMFASRYRVSFLGISIAGLVGIVGGASIGDRLIGNYEYTVATPPDQRVMKLSFKDANQKEVVNEVTIPNSDVKVKHIPIGAWIGIFIGWLLGASVYGLLFGRRREKLEDDDFTDEPAGETPGTIRDQSKP